MPGSQVPNTGFPAVAHPVVYMPYVRTTEEFLVHLVSPGTWDDAATWCGGTKAVVDGGQAVILPNGQGTAKLGEFIVTHDGGVTFQVEEPGGWANRWRYRDTYDGEDPPPLYLYNQYWDGGGP